MNIRLLTVVLGLASVSLVACTVKEGDGTGGGDGDGGSDGGSTATSTADGGSTGTSTADGGGGTGGGDNGFAACKEAAGLEADAECAGCGTAATFGECSAEHLCSSSVAIAEALRACSCGTPEDTTDGACETECADTCATGADATEECGACTQQNCAAEATECANDGATTNG